MEITNVRIGKIVEDWESNIRAYASVELDHSLVVHGIRVIRGPYGLFIGMPSWKTADGQYRDLVYPVRRHFREQLSAHVIGEYHEVLGEIEESNGD